MTGDLMTGDLMTGGLVTGIGNADRLGPVIEDDRGTPASTWAAWVRRFPELELAGWDDVLVVAPHPDDEVLGVGGLLGRVVAAGGRATVVAVTDGDPAYPHSRVVTPSQLAALRTRESAAAGAVLGLPVPVRLGLPDGAVAAHEAALAEALRDLLRPGRRCLATWGRDGHPDHEAAGRAAAAACRASGATLVEYPVWMWHWARPDDPAVPWHRASVLPLSPREQQRKRRAVAEFASQIAPLSADPADAAVLPPFVLDRLVRGEELVFTSGGDDGA